VYRLLFHPGVEKQLARNPRPYAERLVKAIRALGSDPRPSQVKQLDKEMFRLREGDYRIVYAIFDEERIVYIGKVERRSEKTFREIARLLERARQAVKDEN
jgi:mRNA interferase RelE/StbE